MELYKILFRNNSEVTTEIQAFIKELKNEPEFLYFSTTEYEHKIKVFNFIAARMLMTAFRACGESGGYNYLD